MKKLTLAVAGLLLIAGSGAVPRREILAAFEKRLTSLMEAGTWRAYEERSGRLFPAVSRLDPVSVVVEKESLEIGSESFSLGVGYMEVFVESPLEQVRAVLENTRCFQALYDLDRPADMGPPAEDGSFQAHIFKRIPVLSDQDYVLLYKSRISGRFWFQRASLVEDRDDFALRDNLRILESVPGGTIYREIGIVYPLGWIVRAMGATVRGIMRKELSTLAFRLKCGGESPPPWTEEKARECQRRSSGGRGEEKREP